MNIIGKIGQFIIENQYVFEILVLAILLLLVVFLIVKSIIKAIKRKNTLEEIKNQVENISDTVIELKEKEEKLSVKFEESKTVKDECLDGFSNETINKTKNSKKNIENLDKDIILHPKVEITDEDNIISIDIKEADKKKTTTKTISVKIEPQDYKNLDFDIEVNEDEVDPRKELKKNFIKKATNTMKEIEDLDIEDDKLDELVEEVTMEHKNRVQHWAAQMKEQAKEYEAMQDSVDELSESNSKIEEMPKYVDIKDVPKKYIDRLCYIDKDGRVYTEEELKKQIS